MLYIPNYLNRLWKNLELEKSNLNTEIDLDKKYYIKAFSAFPFSAYTEKTERKGLNLSTKLSRKIFDATVIAG